MLVELRAMSYHEMRMKEMRGCQNRFSSTLSALPQVLPIGNRARKPRRYVWELESQNLFDPRIANMTGL